MFPPPMKKEIKTVKKTGCWLKIVVLSVVATVTLFYLIKESAKPEVETPKSEMRKSRRVKSVKPAKPARQSDETRDKKQETEQLKPQRIGEVRNGYRLLPSGRLHKVRGVVKVKDSSNSKLEKLFQEPADQLIAGIITIEPGDFLVGDTGTMFKDFDTLFESALKSPIQINSEDDEYTRELKESVLATRKELLQYRKNGDSLSKVMTETRQQLQELGLYRNELKELVKERIADGDMTDGDYDDLVKAANQMLEERGVKPLMLPKTFKHYIDLVGIEPAN